MKDVEGVTYGERSLLEGSSVFMVDCWPCLLCPSQASWSEDLGTGKTAALPRLPPCDGGGVFPPRTPNNVGPRTRLMKTLPCVLRVPPAADYACAGDGAKSIQD